MDSPCEVKLGIFSAIHGIIDRALHLEQSIEGLMGGLARTIPCCGAAVVVKDDAEVRFFFTQSINGAASDMEQRVRSFYKTGFDLVLRIPQAFVVLFEGPGPLFLDRKALHSLRREQVSLFGAPIFSGDEVVGAILAEGFFDHRVGMFEDVQLLSMLAVLIGRLLGLQSQVRRREEALVKENRALRAKIAEEGLGVVCLGKSEAARRLEASIRKAAPANAPVHIFGEPGTGKSSIARIIHELSGRSHFPFVRVHCSLPEELLEQELFSGESGFLRNGLEELHGHLQPGRRPGAFERAAGGALLLDEVGELSATHQAKLLDLLDGLQTGGFGPKEADVRLLSVSGPQLFARTSAFRKDLLGRLGTLRIHVPPIRERKEDIPFLVEHFLADECRKQGKKARFAPLVLKRLCKHDWPGNIAEMKNTVIRLAIMAEGPEIEVRELDAVLRNEQPPGPASEAMETVSAWSRLDKIELNEVAAALERNRWIRRKAADELGLTFRQMNYRVKKFGLDTLIKENRRLKSEERKSG